MIDLRIEETAVRRPWVKRILVVDDDPTNRLVVRALMERSGYYVADGSLDRHAKLTPIWSAPFRVGKITRRF